MTAIPIPSSAEVPPDADYATRQQHSPGKGVEPGNAEARRLAHALLDAIGERAEAEAIVRDLADADPVRLRLDGRHECGRCGGVDEGWGARTPVRYTPDCPYLCARAFVAREGREETDHE